jgi:rhodanese-related sulfurtransferase
MRFIRISILLLLISTLAIAQSALKVNSIEFKASYYKLKGVLVDVRTAHEYAEGHIENAKNIDVSKDDFAMLVDKLPREQAIFVYCGIGVRSAKAAAQLRKMGFKYVYDLDGGYEDLLKVGMRPAK